MNYYFPSIITSLSFSHKTLPASFHTVNAGKNAIRLLLRSYKLKPKSKVALPLYVCDSLKRAVSKEGLEPLYLDLKPDGTFWADYNVELLRKEKPDVIILVHLYGFLHPDTKFLMDFCKENNIILIHDAAQSYGIDEDLLTYSSGVVYSFGPGKSSTAAGGALVKGLTNEFYKENCKNVSNFLLQEYKAKFFLKSRVYGYKFSLMDKLLQKIIYRFKRGDTINAMTDFQLAAAATALDLVKNKSKERGERYKILEDAAKTNTLLAVPFTDEKGLYFKIVLNVKENVSKFKNYLKENNIPFFSLSDELLIDKNIHSQYPIFSKNARHFIELSTEASLPLEEMRRVAALLKKYS